MNDQPLSEVDIEFADAQICFRGYVDELAVVRRDVDVDDDEVIYEATEHIATRLHVVRDGYIIDGDGSREMATGLYLLTGDGLFQRVMGPAPAPPA